MITILYDKIEPPKELIHILKKMDGKDIAIIVAPTFDYISPLGIRHMPSFLSLVKKLSGRRVRTSYRINEILRTLNFHEERLADLDMIINITATLWLNNKLNLIDYFSRIVEALKIHVKIYPLTDPPITIHILTDNGFIYPASLYTDRYKIKDIKYVGLEATQVPSEVKKILDQSEKILLYQPSFLTIELLKQLKDIEKILNQHSGTIIYFLPKEIDNVNSALLSKFGYPPTWEGIFEMLHTGIDAFIFNENEPSILEVATKYKVSLYPLDYETENKELMNKFVHTVLKILGVNNNSSRKKS